MTDRTLFRGAAELGTLALGDTDFPWYRGGFNATAEFEKVRPLFDELFESVNGKGGDFRDTWNRITEPGLYLQSIHDGKRYDKFILHIRNGNFRLRMHC